MRLFMSFMLMAVINLTVTAGDGIDEIMKSASLGWAEYETMVSRCSGEVRVKATMVREPDIHDTNHSIVTIKQTAFGCIKSTHNGPSGDKSRSPPRQVICVNPKYCFSLVMKTESNSAWLMDQCLPSDDGSGLSSARIPLRTMVSRNILQGISIGTKKLSDLVHYPHYKLLSMSKISHNTLEAYKLVFDCHHAASELPYYFVQSGTVILIPSKNWVIASSEYIMKDSVATSRCSETYSYNQDLTPKKIDVFVESTLGAKYSSIFDYNLSAAANVSDSDFTLTAFGLPEPVGVTWEKPTPRYLFFLAAAAGFAVLVVLFRWLARRRRTAAVQPA